LTAESGLDYFGARYYQSQTGRWLLPDWSAVPVPVPYAVFSNPQSLNLYTYVGNNPVNAMDADGHQASGGNTSTGNNPNYMLGSAECGPNPGVSETNPLPSGECAIVDSGKTLPATTSLYDQVSQTETAQQQNAQSTETARPTGFAISFVSFSNFNLIVNLSWSSSTGNPKDIASCGMAEQVYYPTSGRDDYHWPAPMKESSPNPSSPATANAGAGSPAKDVHHGPSEFTKPYMNAHFDAQQYYSYACPNGQSNKVGPINISRSVGESDQGIWQYTIRLTFGTTNIERSAPLP